METVMTLRVALLGLCISLTLPADWVEIRNGPLVVLGETGSGDAREAANYADQYRWLVGEYLGRTEPKLFWPLTIVVVKPGRFEGPAWGFGRDGWITVWPAKGRPPREFFREFALRLMEDNLQGHMPEKYEDGLADFLSTAEVNQSRLTVGTAPPPAGQSPTWALIHKLASSEETSTRLRVLLSNLANGAQLDVAWRNAFPDRQPPEQAEIEAYRRAGSFPAIPKLGRPVNLELRYQHVPAMPSRVRLIPGDLLLAANRPKEALAAYQAAQNERPSAGGHEGRGLALQSLGDQKEAAAALKAATSEEGAGPRAYIELARMQPTADLARPLLDAAAKLNPSVLEIYTLAAEKESGPVRRAYFLKKAVEISPRRADLWQQLAMAQLGAKEYGESEKSYRRALLEAPTEKDRARYEAQKEQFMQMRLDAEAAERKRQQDEERAEVEKLRLENEASIRAAEARANAKAGQVKSTQKVEQWWDGPPTESVTGELQNVACQGSRARLTLKSSDGKTMQLLIANAGQILLLPQGTAEFRCGPQRPPRRVKIEYVPKPAAQSAGEVASIEFQ